MVLLLSDPFHSRNALPSSSSTQSEIDRERECGSLICGCFGCGAAQRSGREPTKKERKKKSGRFQGVQVLPARGNLLQANSPALRPFAHARVAPCHDRTRKSRWPRLSHTIAAPTRCCHQHLTASRPPQRMPHAPARGVVIQKEPRLRIARSLQRLPAR